jgi:organic hydroperoxide reductase OsmC/OhrA
MKTHHYELTVKWTGNMGTGTSGYDTYSRNHTIVAQGKPEIAASSDPAFRGDGMRYNPEEMLVASLSSCHMLWYLHLCADAGVVVLNYTDNPTGIMTETKTGGGRFSEVTLKPMVIVAEPHMIAQANTLHQKANEMCFIARSVNFPVHHAPFTRSEQPQ